MIEGRDRSSSIGLLYSQTSLNECVQAARQTNAIYNFSGATGDVEWLRGEYAYLAPNGVAALLQRLCIKFTYLSDEEIADPSLLARYHTVIVPHAVRLSRQGQKVLSDWVGEGGYLLATGRTDLPRELMGLSSLAWYVPQGYTAIDFKGYHAVVGCRGYSVVLGEPASGSEVMASGYEIKDFEKGIDFESAPALGPAVIRSGTVVYITLPFFETVGAMLQGHINFEEIRGVGHRVKYLDWLARLLRDLLDEAGWRHLWRIRLKPWGEHPGVVVLRHDVDESTDMTYLDYERNSRIPATYAILNDRQCEHWLTAVAMHPGAEAAYHFDTSPERIPAFEKLLSYLRGVTPPISNKADGVKLWKQFKKARDSLGIPIVTGQRHNSSFYYPEIVDAMDYLYKQELEVLGLGTMFRFTNFMYGARSKDDRRTYVVQQPDTSVPFWFPFKLWYASTCEHRSLRGWDITHVLEPEPWLTKHLLDQTEYLSDGVYTLGFHPAHCCGKSFRPEGNREWFEYAVELGRSSNYLFATCREVFERMERWEYLEFGFHHEEGWVRNQRLPYAVSIHLEHPGGCLSFKDTPASAEFLGATLTKIVLEPGELINFSIG
jgi:hypothetical protein